MLAAFVRLAGAYQLSSHAAAWFGIDTDGVNSNILSALFWLVFFILYSPGT